MNIDNNMLVSIIIPVYNVEAYLTECLDSVVNQTFRDMEIILVDDGSTDNSPEIMQAFAEKDSRIKIITQPNRGVSAARNTGLRAASGEYILFVDSDDTILPETVETLYNKIRETDSDLLLGNELFCHENKRWSMDFKRDEALNSITGISGKACYIKLMEVNAFPPSAPLFFIRRELITLNSIFFKEGIIHEDELWCVEAMLNAKRVSLIDFNYYLYRQREGSIMHSNNHEFRIKSLFIVTNELNKLAKKENDLQGVTGHIFTRMYSLFYSIGELLQSSSISNETKWNKEFPCFSKLLIEIYPFLSYLQQRICLTGFACLVNSWEKYFNSKNGC